MRKAKFFTTWLVTILIGVTSITAANADEPSYTLEEFQLSANYSDLDAAEKASNLLLTAANGVELEMTDDLEIALLGNKMRVLTMNVQATKTAAKLIMSTQESSSEIFTSGDKYYVGIDEVWQQNCDSFYINCNSPKYLKSVTSRISKNNIKYVQQATNNLGLDADPSSFFPWSYTDRSELLTQFRLGDLDKFRFGPITKETADLGTTYSFKMKFSDSTTGISHELTTTEFFEPNGFMSSVTILDKMTTMILSGSTEIKITQKINNELNLTAPAEDSWVEEVVFKKASAKFIAESELLEIAKKIVVKAGIAAKKSKVAISKAHLVSSARAIRWPAAQLPNGIKIGHKVSGQKASVCIVITKGKASSKTC